MNDDCIKTILLVEDEILIALSEKRDLERYQYHVLFASSGEEAIEVFGSTHTIDLVLMDIDLGSGIDGPETALRILKERDVPVVFLSSHMEPEIVEKTEKITSYGYVVKNSSITVLDASIKMAFKLFSANQKIIMSSIRQNTLIANTLDVIGIGNREGLFAYISKNIEKCFGWKDQEIIGRELWPFIHPDDVSRVRQGFSGVLGRSESDCIIECRFLCKNGVYIPTDTTITNMIENPAIEGMLLSFHNISEHKRLEDALEKRIIALTRPMNDQEEISFEELFNLSLLQKIQDEFAYATGVASIITLPDGKPITRPSNFTRFCSHVIRTNEQGLVNCFKSDAALGRHNPGGSIVQPCLSGGLWDGGASITVGDTHVANWLIGQVRDETQSEEAIRVYAHSIGVDEEDAVIAFREVPEMSVLQFRKISQALFTLANQLSTSAYQNLQQARLIADLNEANEKFKVSEEQLHIVNKELNHIQSLAQIGNWRFELSDRIFLMSEECLRIFGFLPNAKPSFDEVKAIFVNESESEALEIFERVVTTGNNYNIELQIIKKNSGELRTIVTNVKVQFGENGSPVAIIGTSQDITDRKRAELTLWEFGEIYRSILNASPDDITITDLYGRILMVSPAALTMFRCCEEDLIGHFIVDFIDEKDKARAQKNIATLANGNTLSPGEYCMHRFDGTVFDIEANGKHISGENGQQIQMVFIIRDITERKIADEKIKNLLAEKELILREVHHRIKNNMNTIYSLLLLQASTLPDAAALHALEDAANRVRSMMTLYAKLYQATDSTEISIAQYLPYLIDEIIMNFPNSKSVSIVKDVEDFILNVRKLQPLGIIINELVTNIMKYAFQGKVDGEIRLVAKQEKGLVVVSISDNGNGMPESVSFEKSTGFGLVLVAGLIKQIEGTIRIERDRGTKIIMEFPI